MIERYEIFLRAEAIEALHGIRGNPRNQIAAFINSLASDPAFSGDYTVEDSTGRIICIKIVGSYAITFWADHPAREIKITDIRSADRA